MHVKFAALVPHDKVDQVQQKQSNYNQNQSNMQQSESSNAGNPDEIAISEDGDDDEKEEEEEKDGGAAENASKTAKEAKVAEEPYHVDANGDLVHSDTMELKETVSAVIKESLEDEDKEQNTIQESSTAETTVQSQTPVSNPKKYTRFLALDKCLRNRDFLQVCQISHFEVLFSINTSLP
jgi:hypothetical protein